MIKQFKPAAHRLLIFALAPLAAVIATLTFTGAVRKPAKFESPVSAESAAKANREKSAAGLEQLNKMWQEQKDLASAQSQKVDELRRESGIIGDPTNSESISNLHVEKIKSIWTEISRLDIKIAERSETLNALKKPSALYTLLESTPDPGLTHLVQELEVSERDLAKLLHDFSEDHPKVREVIKTRETVEKQISKRVEGAREAMGVNLESDIAIRARLQKELGMAQDEYSNAVERSRPYFKARRELETREKMRDSIYIRILQETVDLNTSTAK